MQIGRQVRKAIAQDPGDLPRRGFLFPAHGSRPPIDQGAQRRGWDKRSLPNLANFKAAFGNQRVEPSFSDARNLAGVGNTIGQWLGMVFNDHGLGSFAAIGGIA